MRKAYTKPGMTRVTLVPSEAVLSACRDNTLSIHGSLNGCWYGSGDPFMASCKETVG
jgi:hypothetical protein